MSSFLSLSLSLVDDDGQRSVRTTRVKPSNIQHEHLLNVGNRDSHLARINSTAHLRGLDADMPMALLPKSEIPTMTTTPYLRFRVRVTG